MKQIVQPNFMGGDPITKSISDVVREIIGRIEKPVIAVMFGNLMQTLADKDILSGEEVKKVLRITDENVEVIEG